MEFSARDICDMLNGVIVGDEEQKISTLSKIEEAEIGSLTFLANPKYSEFIYTTGASLAIVGKDFSPEKALPKGLTLIKVDNPYTAFAQLLEAYDTVRRPSPSISSNTDIHATAKIGKDVYIASFVSIGANSIIGDGVIIHENTTIRDNVTIGAGTVINTGCSLYFDTIVGDNCVLHSGVVLGADGFGFAPKSDGFKKVVQIGNVIVGNNVEIGSNSCIDRATLGSTIIGNNVKLDNLIQIGHNVEIGENTVIAAQTGIAGSTKIGKNCMIGGQVGINGHIVIADGTKIGGHSGVVQSVLEENKEIQGYPAMESRDFKRSFIYFRKLPEIKAKLDNLDKEIKNKS